MSSRPTSLLASDLVHSTFLAIRQPGIILRSFVLAGQGVFGTFFLATYIVSPKSAHRFVATLEEEAVRT